MAIDLTKLSVKELAAAGKVKQERGSQPKAWKAEIGTVYAHPDDEGQTWVGKIG